MVLFYNIIEVFDLSDVNLQKQLYHHKKQSQLQVMRDVQFFDSPLLFLYLNQLYCFKILKLELFKTY